MSEKDNTEWVTTEVLNLLLHELHRQILIPQAAKAGKFVSVGGEEP